RDFSAESRDAPAAEEWLTAQGEAAPAKKRRRRRKPTSRATLESAQGEGGSAERAMPDATGQA
ncbi:MAG: hypothetical protein ABIR35_01575, partial [Polaromonas sp.]